MKNVAKAIWMGRLYYVAVTLAWALSLWLWWSKTALTHGPIGAFILGLLALYLIATYWRILVDNSLGQFVLDAGVALPIASLVGLAVFHLLSPYNSLSLTWLVAIICGLLVAGIIDALIIFFEDEVDLTKSLVKKEEAKVDVEGIVASGLFWDWFISLALPIFVFIWVLLG